MRVRDRGLALGALCATLGVFLFEHLAVQPQIDDAYISYRYAANLVEGHGLVYNPGERVEGITNLLWTLLVALGLVLGGRAEEVGHALGALAGGATLVAAFAYTCVGTPLRRLWLAALAPCIVLSAAGFGYAVTCGLETPLHLALVTAALAAQARGRLGWAVAIAGLATMTRPDGALVAVVILGFHLLSNPLRRPRTWVPVVAFGIAIAALTSFRMLYYGSPVPNTFYAKVGGVPWTHGLESLRGYLAFGFAGLLPAALFAVRRRLAWPGLVFCGLTMAYTVAVSSGGGAFSRFLLPTLPIGAVLAVWGARDALAERPTGWPIVVASVPSTLLWFWMGAAWGMAGLTLGALASLGVELRGRHRRAPLALAALAAGAAALLAFGVPSSIEGSEQQGLRKRSSILERRRTFDRRMHRHNQKVARRLVSEVGEDRLLAVGAIGAIGFYSRYRIIDYFGLVDRHVAQSQELPEGDLLLGFGHQRSNAAYVLGRRPDLILMPAPNQRLELPAHMAISQHPDFERLYAWDDELGVYRRRAAPEPGEL